MGYIARFNQKCCLTCNFWQGPRTIDKLDKYRYSDLVCMTSSSINKGACMVNNNASRLANSQACRNYVPWNMIP